MPAHRTKLIERNVDGKEIQALHETIADQVKVAMPNPGGEGIIWVPLTDVLSDYADDINTNTEGIGTLDAIKLGKTATAADSAKLGGKAASEYATAEQGTKADSAYQKPSGGIPKTDLAGAVQTSLGKADSALQSVPDATASVKGAVLLGAGGGAARYGQKGDVGLGNADNTSDANKPVSTATQTALDTKLTKSGDTMTGKLVLPVGTTSAASLNVPHGAAPSSPVNGDIWTTTAAPFVCLNGTTRTIYHNGNASTAALTTATQAEAETGTSTTVRAWTPQRVSQAIASAQAADSAKLGGKTASEYALISQLSPGNLLINGDFAINQRGYVNGTPLTYGQYCFDRWCAGAAAVSVICANGRVTINGAIMQIIENPALLNQTVTFSVESPSTRLHIYLDDGFGERNNGYIDAGTGRRGVTLTLGETYVSNVYLVIRPADTQEIEFSRVQLVTGTGIEWQPRHIAEELAICQRYFQIRSDGNIPAADLRPSMKNVPTIYPFGSNHAYDAEL